MMKRNSSIKILKTIKITTILCASLVCYANSNENVKMKIKKQREQDWKTTSKSVTIVFLSIKIQVYPNSPILSE